LERLDNLKPLILIASGLFGAAGVALAAAASHGGDTRLLGTASTMCLIHAPALAALHAGRFRTATLAALVIAVGTLVFAGDLLARHALGSGLFPMAAPTGGTVMIVGWLLVAVGGFFRKKT